MLLLITTPLGAALFIVICIVSFLVAIGCLCCLPCFCRSSKKNRDGEYQMVEVVPTYHYDAVESFAPSAPPVSLIEYSEGSSRSNASFVEGKPRDVWAAVFFVINVAFVLFLCFRAWQFNESKNFFRDSEIDLTSNGAFFLIYLTVAFSLIGLILGCLWIGIIIFFSESIIHLVLIVTCISSFVAALMAFLSENIISALILFAVAVLTTLYYRSIFNRIPFASSILRISARVINSYRLGLFSCAVGVQAINICWMLLYFVAGLGITVAVKDYDKFNSNGNNEQTKNVAIFLLILLSFAFFWGYQTLRYVLQTTVAGVSAVWWYDPFRIYPVRGSLFRSLTYSFGSICFGSLIVAAIQTIREIFNLFRRRTDERGQRYNESVCENLFLCFISNILSLIESTAMYVNRYAFCYVAAHGMSFLDAGKNVMDLFSRRGWTTLVNDSLISNVLSLVVFSFTVLTSIVGASFALFWGDYFSHMCNIPVNSIWMACVIIGGITGFLSCSALVTVIDSAVAMIYVCFAEHPVALQGTHPHEFHELIETWNRIFPLDNDFLSTNYQDPEVGVLATAYSAPIQSSRTYPTTKAY